MRFIARMLRIYKACREKCRLTFKYDQAPREHVSNDNFSSLAQSIMTASQRILVWSFSSLLCCIEISVDLASCYFKLIMIFYIRELYNVYFNEIHLLYYTQFCKRHT